MADLNLSISDINSYLRCRRAWDIGSTNRQSLRHKITPKIFFIIGSAVHEAIDAQAAGKDPMQAFDAYVDKERVERVTFYQEAVGQAPWTSEMNEFDEAVDLARSLTIQYFEHYGWENPVAERGLKYIGTEIPFEIPLRPGVNFVGTFDGLLTDIETESKFWLAENKTAGAKPRPELLQHGNQYKGYNWAFRTLTGVTPAGTLYNGILKRLIKSPKVLTSGKLSVDKSASVTLQSFLTAVQKGNHEITQYLKYIEMLEERERQGDSRFFVRDVFTYTDFQLDSWYTNVLQPLSEEMASPPNLTPNFTSCDMCLVSDLCTSMELGEDVDRLKTAKYEVKSYGTMEAVKTASPSTVSNASELMELLNGA